MTRLRPPASRAGFGAASPFGAALVVAIALAVGLSLRLVRLDARPMHHDEANQAIKFGALLEHGEYAYDAYDHHGPTLYYLTLPVAWLRGQATLASLDEWTLRVLPVAFGAATLLLLPLLPAAIDPSAKASAALLMAVSPAMVFYSRMYIQESMFACFALAFAIALGRSLTEPGLRWPVLAGFAAGLTAATKETAALVLPAALAAAAAAWASLGPARATVGSASPSLGRAALVTGGIAAVVAAVFYSSFLANPAGILAPFGAAPTYLQRGVDAGAHLHPWHFYLHRLGWWTSGGLSWTEAVVLGLAALGTVAAWVRPDPDRPEATFWRRYLTGNAVLTLAVYSAVPYKTPWNLVPFYVLTLVAAGVGVAAVVRALASRRIPQVALAGALSIAAAHLGWQAWRAAVVYAADPRNPYVYAQTVPDAVRLAARIRDLATLHPDRHGMLVFVVAPPNDQWPLPWYLRAMPHVGYWADAKELPALQAPVIVASEGNVEQLDAALGDRYVSEFFGLRPEVLLTVYIERGLWDRFLATRQALSGG